MNLKSFCLVTTFLLCLVYSGFSEFLDILTIIGVETLEPRGPSAHRAFCDMIKQLVDSSHGCLGFFSALKNQFCCSVEHLRLATLGSVLIWKTDWRFMYASSMIFYFLLISLFRVETDEEFNNVRVPSTIAASEESGNDIKSNFPRTFYTRNSCFYIPRHIRACMQ